MINSQSKQRTHWDTPSLHHQPASRSARHGILTDLHLGPGRKHIARLSPSVIRGDSNRLAALPLRVIDTLPVTTNMNSQTAVRVDQQEVASEIAKQFSWTARWWPIHDVESLDPKIPMHVDLLGMSLVVWADTKGAWHCLEDKCPHRLAPLSEGRVEPQGLMCCYHGWTFDGNGSCTSIPQMAPDAEAAACSSKRACVKSYPTMIAHGLLWVWPEAGQTEAAQAAAPALIDSVNVKGVAPWVVRDLPVRYDFLLENLIDPSHIDYAHHGVAQASRYKNMISKSWSGMTVSPVTMQGYEAATTTSAYGNNKVAFAAPNRVRYSNNGQAGFQLYVVPTKPGWSKVIFNMPDPKPLLNQPTPSWFVGFDHVYRRNAILDGDALPLHKIERIWTPSKGLGIKALAKAFYMPAKTDSSVIAFREWIEQFAGPIPTCRPEDEPFMPPLMPQEQVLDRYNQHVKHCVHCKRSLRLTETAIQVTRIVGVVAAFAAVAQTVVAGAVSHMQLSGISVTHTSAVASWWQVLGETGMSTPMAVSMVLVVGTLFADKWLNNVRRKFFFEEYIHALRD